jgi:orotate phosphoribosyltransferase
MVKAVDLIRQNTEQTDSGKILDFFQLIHKSENMKTIGERLYAKLNENCRMNSYDIIGAVNVEGLVLATLLGAKTDYKGICNAFAKNFSYGNRLLPEGSVKGNVLLTTGIITDGYDCFESARTIIRNGGTPVHIATVVDYDKNYRFGKGTAKERIMAIHKEGDAKMDFGVTALVKESELNL